MIIILLVFCLLFEVSQILDITTTHTALKKGMETVELNPFFKKIERTRKIPLYLIFIKCLIPIVLFITISLLFSYNVQLIPFIYLVFVGIITIISFAASINNFIVYRGVKKNGK